MLPAPEARKFSAALCRGLIEASARRESSTPGRRFPRLYAAASLKRQELLQVGLKLRQGFPRLYAAASLKLYSRHYHVRR